MKSRRQKKREVSKRKTSRSKPEKIKLRSMYKFFLAIFKLLIVIILTISFAATGVVGGLIFGYIRTAAPISPDQLMPRNFTTIVYDDDNIELAKLDAIKKNRMYARDSEIPEYLKKAFVAIEDERFYDHPGIDLPRIAGAAVNLVISKIAPGEGDIYGASTITQQVVKNVTGDDEVSLRRKVQEWWKAIQLEMNLEKWQILELYMNLINMGGNIHGVKVAAQEYFGKNVSELSLAECASLAGITNRPLIYTPTTTSGRENNKQRQETILSKMLELGFIGHEEYEQAIQEELKFKTGDSNKPDKTSNQSYFIDKVVIDIKNDLLEKGWSEQMALNYIYNAGLKIHTTMDSDIQKAMDEIYTNDDYFPVLDETIEHPQSGMIIINPHNGHIKALYGGYGIKKADAVFNRATSPQMKRQPGSSFKPIAVYGPAIDTRRITAATIIDDAPVYMLGMDEERYPENYDHTYKGLTNIRDGLRNSVNVVAAKVWKNILGPDLSLKYLKKVNINRDNERYVSISMGGLHEGVNPLQMAAAYVPFINKGVYYKPVSYTKVVDKNGEVILENETESKIVYDETSAYIMTDMMKDVCRRGTAYPYGIIRNGDREIIPTAGKTGTTSDNYDKWFVGFSPYYVAATWYGYDTPTTMKPAEYSQALKIWNAVMTKVHNGLEPIEFSMPPGIIRKDVCIYSGKIPTDLCRLDPRCPGINSIRNEIFIKGTEPEEKCDIHAKAEICTESRDIWGRNLLAGPYCPPLSVEEKIFIKRREPFMPIKPDDPLPFDWQYELPAGEYCNIHGNPSYNNGFDRFFDDMDNVVPGTQQESFR